jgi:hypothetical protein
MILIPPNNTSPTAMANRSIKTRAALVPVAVPQCGHRFALDDRGCWHSLHLVIMALASNAI